MPAWTASDGGELCNEQDQEVRAALKSENAVHLDPVAGWFLVQGALFKLFVSNSSKCFAAPRQSVNLEVVRCSVVCAEGLSTCVEKMRVSVLFFFLTRLVGSSAVGLKSAG